MSDDSDYDVMMQAEDGTLLFWCAGCNEHHGVWLEAHPNPQTKAWWKWNGDRRKPTITPSLHVLASCCQPNCHSYITDGMIQYLPDCQHALTGQTIPIPPNNRPPENGPRQAKHGVATL